MITRSSLFTRSGIISRILSRQSSPKVLIYWLPEDTSLAWPLSFRGGDISCKILLIHSFIPSTVLLNYSKIKIKFSSPSSVGLQYRKLFGRGINALQILLLFFTWTAVSQRKKYDSAPPVDDCMRSVIDGNDDVCPMQIHIHAYYYVRGFIENKTGNIEMSNLDVFWEKHHTIRCLWISNKF